MAMTDYPGRNPRTDPLTRSEVKRWILDGSWPHHPVAPVKHKEKGHGLILWVFVPGGGSEDRPVRIYMKGLWDLKEGTYAENFEGVATIDYADMDAFLDDGWEID